MHDGRQGSQLGLRLQERLIILIVYTLTSDSEVNRRSGADSIVLGMAKLQA